MGLSPADQLLTVWNAGGGALSYSVVDDSLWLSVTPASGTLTPQDHTVSIDVTGLSAGIHTGTIIVTDPYAANNPVRVPVTLTISAIPPLSITTTSIPDGIRGTAYSIYLYCSGGVGDVTWSVSAGSFPPGLLLESTEGGTGWIVGTPTVAGYFSFTVQAQTALQSVTQPLSMTVADWVARYNGPTNGGDDIVEWASAVVAVDASGNLYVTGRSLGSGTGPIDCVTLKYSSAGVEQWAARYNGPANGADEGKAIAVDSMGYVYITGRSTGSGGDDYATIKYASDGTRQWVASYNGPVNGSDSGVAIAVDSTGNVYVTGYSPGSGTGYDFATVKYDSAGVEQWAARYNGTASGFDEGRAIAFDPSGNVYVTGRSTETGSGDDYATIKYAGNGVQQWVAHYTGPGNALDSATAIAVDPSGNVYVTGTSAGNGTSADFATIKYSSAGSEQWVRRYNGPADGMDDGAAIAVDPSGNVYVTGPSAAIGTDSDYATIKYDGSGAPQWVARYNGPGAPGNNEDSATDIILDPLGNVYVTGESVGSGGYLDFATVKYDGAGAMHWAARYDHTENNTDACRALAMDPLGNICVAGISYDSASNYDIASVRYVQSFPSTLLIATEAMDVGYINTQYAKTLWAFGGSGGTRTWSLVGGSLPPGMDLSAVTGRIAGTPNTAGTYNFRVRVQEYGGGMSDESDLSLTVLDRIAFHSDRDGNAEIYVMNADGTGQKNLTNNSVDDVFYGAPWSPDGSRIVFLSNEYAASHELFIMNSDGSGRTRLTPGLPANNPQWSPDGSRILFEGNVGSQRDIFTIYPDGSGLTNLSANPANDANVDWSPDGSRVVFNSERTGNDEIYVMNADGTNPVRLTNNSGTDLLPNWSPDGTRIAFVSNRADGGGVLDYEIYVMNADGTNQTQLTVNTAFDYLPYWSPDSNRILFHSNRDGTTELYVTNADGSDQTRLTYSGIFPNVYGWSPDGSRIIFVRNLSGNYEIFVMNADGSGIARLTNNPAGENNPYWSQK